MHISEGILDVSYCAAGYVITAAITAYSLKKTKSDNISAIAVMGAAFFTASLIHFKVGVTSVHLTMIGITALILGSSAPLAILAGMFFQAVMFQHGGISTLGVNSAVMMLPALTIQFLFTILTKSSQDKPFYVAITAGVLTFFAVLLAMFLSVSVLWFSDTELAGIIILFVVSNSLLAVVEGLFTGIIIYRLIKIKPEMINSWK